MFWLVRQIARRAPGRLLLGAVAAALPVATLEYRALATTLNVDSSRVATQLRDVNGVRAVDVFGAQL
jgi:hypothetical protein